MKSIMKLLVVTFALLICIPAAFAQTPETSTLPVTEPLDVGGTILQPGTYMIRVLPRFADRNQVQVTSIDGKTVFATVLTIPHQLEPGEEIPATTFVFYPTGEGQPRALRTWFAPHPDASEAGHDIVYQESRAKQLARLANSRVVSYQGEPAVADLTTAPLIVITPQATVETYTSTAPSTTETTTTTTTPVATETPTPIASTASETPAPMTSATSETSQVTESKTTEMPRTASSLPLIALLGLLSVGAALAVRVARTD